MRPDDGFLLLRKPRDVTSFQALTPIKRALPGTKIGHSGTLDRFAEGLLLVVCGRMTRLVPLLTGLEKEYVAEIRFGEETNTLDPEGQVIERGPTPGLERIRAEAVRFLGPIDQVPPQYSAVHVEGERAYQAARAGRTVAIAPRRVVILQLDILDYSPPAAHVRVVCSSGTYIRALARDLGRSCGTCAHVGRLERRRIGPFELCDAVGAAEFSPERDMQSWRACLSRLPDVEEAEVAQEGERVLRSGGPIDPSLLTARPQVDGRVAVYDRKGEFVALLRRESGRFRYDFVIPGAGR